MSLPEVLICPRTDQPCAFSDYCKTTRDGESTDQPFSRSIGMLRRLSDEVVPEELREARYSSFCSSQRIVAIGQAAEAIADDYLLESGDPLFVKRSATNLIAGILAARGSTQF